MPGQIIGYRDKLSDGLRQIVGYRDKLSDGLRQVARGRTDVVVFMRDAVYVMELKMRGSAREALEQIKSKDYAIPYQTEGKPVVRIGIAFSQKTRTVSDWIIENDWA